MRKRLMWLAALLAVSTTPAWAQAQGDDAAAGRALWNTTMCRNCHGADGEGGFGPDLAGRDSTAAQFIRAVRQPWGVMPAFTDAQLTDQQLANIAAYFRTLPRVTAPGPWRVPVAATMPLGQQLATSNGCTQCHGAELTQLRAALGAVAPDFAWFSRLVYSHTASMPELEEMLGGNNPIRMGHYSPLRLPEPVMQQIWQFMTGQLGFRARVLAQLAPAAAVANGTQYTLQVSNGGVPSKGLTAEDVTVALTLPSGATVAGTTGTGYQGVRKNDAGADVATWRVPRLAPREMQTFTITLSGATTGLQAATVNWVRPVQKVGAMGDNITVQLPRPAGSQ